MKPVVIVPTFNHGGTLTGVLDRLVPLGLPIIVVDDGSTDQTAARLAEWIRQHVRSLQSRVPLELRTHAHNRGKGAALKTGFAVASELGATHAVTIDADGQLDPADIPGLIEIARRNPNALVLGQRPAAMPGCPARCAIGRRATNLAIRAQCGLRITDSQCGLRIYPLKLTNSVRCVASRYSFEAEIIPRAVWAGFDVIPAPVQCHYFPPNERISHFRPWVDSLRQAWVHLRLLARAIVPWPHHVVIVDQSKPPGVDPRPWWRRFLAWFNPVQCWREARAGDLGRLELAAALGIGVWIGTTPLFGLHVPLCAYFAWRLHLHPAAMILGSQVSLPPIAVVLAIASTWLGHLLLTGHLLHIDHLHAAGKFLPWLPVDWLPAWALGSVVLGFVLGFGVFWLTLLLGMLPRRARRQVRIQSAFADQLIEPNQLQPLASKVVDHARQSVGSR